MPFEIPTLGPWDALLVLVVSVQTTILAYVHHPRWKALMISLPVPFSVAIIAVGRPVDATNVTGLILLAIFTHAVRILHLRFRVPIIAAIAVSVVMYCVLGWTLAQVLPQGDAAFWIACGVTALLGMILLRFSPHREEPGHRSPLPVWIKMPCIMSVICLLVLIKSGLKGFTTVFPMVGVVAAYEARHSLWTVSRQMPILILTLMPMIVMIRVTQPIWGIAVALAIGWVVLLVLLWMLQRPNVLRWGRRGHGR